LNQPKWTRLAPGLRRETTYEYGLHSCRCSNRGPVLQGPAMSRRRRLWIKVPLLVLGVLLALLCSVWAYGAVYYNGPFHTAPWNSVLAVAWSVATLVALVFARSGRKRAIAWLVCFLVVLLPWLLIRPSNDREWQPDWGKTGRIETAGDTVTFHNFRNFDHSLEGETTERWESRTVDVRNLQGLVVFLDKFGGDLIAHPIMSFDFGADGYIALSVETRREVGESYSEFAGLYKRFELQYLFGDEKDLIRLRTNIRNEPVYLYRIKIPPDGLRERFADCIRVGKELSEHPRFYNVLTANCTTSLRAQTQHDSRKPFDIRLIANGMLDELAYERGSLYTGGMTFPKLLEQALINDAALAAHNDPAFSERIREGRSGFALDQ
jgi:hypothetical protein